MQRRAARPDGSASTAVRPLSSSTRWNSCPSVAPVHIEVYGFIRSPVDERGSSCRNTSRSRQVGTSFSMPMTVISVRGRVRHIRPLPSDSTTASVPVAATAKFAPDTATDADRNFRRRCRRAASASAAGSSVNPGSTSAISRRKMSRISARLRWIAGTRMCEGRSCPSCTISSARSVSQAAIPAAASASLSPISWVAIDLTLTTSSAPAARTSETTIRLASAASRAQCTCPPRAVTSASRRSRWVSRAARVASLIAAPAARSAAQSGTSPTTAARLARMVPVALPRLRRSWVSASARRAAAGNASVPCRCAVSTARGIPMKVLSQCTSSA